MKFVQILSPAAVIFGTVSAWGELGTYWTTVVTTPLTTYCSSATTFVHLNVTYTAAQETTITITNCPCTIYVSQPALITATADRCTDEPSYTGSGGAGPLPTGTITKIYPTYGSNSSTVVTYTPPVTTFLSGTVPITTSRPTTLVPGSASNTATKTTLRPSTYPATVPFASATKVGSVSTILAVGVAALALYNGRLVV